MSLVRKLFNISEEDSSCAICSLCNKPIKRGNSVKSYSTSPLLKHLKGYHQKELSEAETSSLCKKAVSGISAPVLKIRKLTAMNQASIESYRPENHGIYTIINIKL